MKDKYNRSLVAPLDKDELHFFNITYSLNKCIDEILEIINDKANGIYLISGMRGVGKTSIINLCSKKYWSYDLIKIKINCSRIIGVESFIYFFMEELSTEMKKIDLPHDIIEEFNCIRRSVNSKVSNKIISKKNIVTKEGKKVEQVNEIGQSFKFNIIYNTLEFIKNYKHNTSQNSINEKSDIDDIVEEIEERNDIFILIDKISNFLVKIDEKYNIVVIIDEMDKQSRGFMEELLDNHKNLFFNSHITTFFIVDLLQHIEITSGNELDNMLSNYITKSIYIPTLNIADIKDYVYREFDISNYKELILINYLTCGVFRKINTYKYLNGYKEQDTFLKAYIYYMATTETEKMYMPLYIKDLCKIFLKDIIQELFYKGKINKSYIKKYLERAEERYMYKFDLYKIIIRTLNQMSEKDTILRYILLLEGDGEYILNTGEQEYKLEIDYSHKRIEYSLEDRYKYKINNFVNKKKPMYVKISNNQPYDVYYIIRLIQTFKESIENIYIVIKIGSEIDSYSLNVEVNKNIGQVLYTIEDFSFSDEAGWAMQEFEKFLEENEIKKIYIEIDDEPVESNIDYIRNVLYKKINEDDK